MLIQEVGSRSLKTSLLASSPLWKRPAEQVQPLDLAAFVQFWRLAGKGLEAQQNADRLIGDAIKCMARGEIKNAPFVAFIPDDPLLTAGELVGMLSILSVARRKALLFGLEMQMTPSDVVKLTRLGLRKIKGRSPLAQAIIDQFPAHIRLQYVFWENNSDEVAMPLIGLEHQIADASYGLGYERLLALYQNLLWCDEEAEVASFTETLSTV